MTNQSSDTQPALRWRNVLVRGGRLTRFKGQVVSLAPGLSVVATAAMLFTGSVDQAAAQAANACGTDEVGQDTVTCIADADPNTPDVVDPYNDGITYTESDGLTLILDDADIEVGGSGVSVEGTGEGNVSVQIGNGKVGTNSDNTYGLYVRATGDGDATLQMDGGTVTAVGGAGFFSSARALHAWVDNWESDATATVSMAGGVVDTSGDFSSGLWAWTNGTGEAIAQMDGGTVTTTGREAHGIWAVTGDINERTENEGAMATALMTDGDVTTKGENAYGIVASAHTLGAATARMEGGTVTTEGVGAHGLFAWIYNRPQSGAAAKAFMTGGKIATDGDGAHGISALTVGRGDASVDMERGTVTTEGVGAHGLFATSGSTGTLATGAEAKAKAIIRLRTHAIVTAKGANSDGIRVSGILVPETSDPDSDRVQLGARGFDIDVAGSVTGGSGNGAAIRTISSKTGTIDIASTAHVNAGSSGIAIRTETAAAGGDGVPRAGTDDGTAAITSDGNIRGDILLDAGNDTLILKGGSFAGGIYGGDGNNEVTISAAVTYEGSHILDGGAGEDRLTLRGQKISRTTNTFLNWEHVALEQEAQLSLSGVSRLDTALDINARSEFRAFGEQSGTRTEMTIAGDVTNDGSVVFSVQDGAADDEIRIEGDYSGSGTSTFALDAVVNGNATNVDQVVFTGDMSGDMEVSISSVGGAGAEGGPLAIDVVTVDGASNGTFRLMEGNHVMSDGEHAMISGAYLYRLAETDSGWALSALSEDDEITWQPASPLYDSYGAALLAFNTPASLRNRGSSQDFRSLAWDGGAGADTAGQDAGSPLWVQMGTEQITSSEENSTTGAALESGLWEMEMGADIVLNDSAAGLLVGGLMLSYATGSTDVSSDFGDGSIDTTGLGLGLAATWYDTRRFYVDGQFTFASYSSDLSSDGRGSLIEGNGGTGYALSIEAGQRFDLGSRLTVIPQAQLSLSSVTFSDFTSERREGPQGEAQQEQVALREATSQRLRLGLEFGEQDPGASGLYGMVNLFHEFGAGSEVEVDGASLTTEHEPWAVGVGLGGTYAWNDRVDLFGEASYATGLSNAGETSALSASAGLKVTF